MTQPNHAEALTRIATLAMPAIMRVARERLRGDLLAGAYLQKERKTARASSAGVNLTPDELKGAKTRDERDTRAV